MTVNVKDYIAILEQMSDPLSIAQVPDRHRLFSCMTCQWSYLMRLWQAGMGHTEGGIQVAKEGFVAVQC